jgi:hypothetical protein
MLTQSDVKVVLIGRSNVHLPTVTGSHARLIFQVQIMLHGTMEVDAGFCSWNDNRVDATPG